MNKPQRVGLSKKLRFSIFARDNFTCRYCGQQSDQVKLVLDHVIPIAKGGTNDEVNLITACEACNQGKAAKLLSQAAPTEADRLRMAQECNEQRGLAEKSLQAIRERKQMLQIVADMWCEIRGQTQVDTPTIRTIHRYVEEYGIKIVSEWIEQACRRMPKWKSDRQIGRYVSGIRRSIRQSENRKTERIFDPATGETYNRPVSSTEKPENGDDPV